MRKPETVGEVIARIVTDAKRGEVEGYVCAIRFAREYGGPEEGGWYFNTEDPLAALPVTSEEAVERAVRWLWSEGYAHDEVVFRREWPTPEPVTRPRYE